MTRGKALLVLIALYVLLKIYGSGVIPIPIPPAPTPITMAVVIYESEIGKGSTFDESEVIAGKLANEMRKVNKFRALDKDQLPEDMVILRDIARAGQNEPQRWIPWLFIFHGKDVSWSGRLPVPESAIVDLVKQQGGI
jgi:hypothetical protein